MRRALLFLALTTTLAACRPARPPAPPPIPAPSTRLVRVVVRTADDRPLLDPTADVRLTPYQRESVTVIGTLVETQWVFELPASVTGGATLAIVAPCCLPHVDGVVLDPDLPEVHLAVRPPPIPGPEVRAPLPPFPSGTYDHELPWSPPPIGDGCDYMRGNFWSVTVPGLPWVPGASSEHPERAISWFFYKWSPQWQQAILDAHSRRGYTHYLLMWEDAQRDGMGLAEFISMAKRIRQQLPCMVISLSSKDISPRDQTPAQFIERIGPAYDWMLSEGAAAEYILGFEWDLWNDPRYTVPIAQWFGDKAHAAGASAWLHFSTERGWWGTQETGTGNRFDFWRQLVGHIDGLDYQGDPAWDINTYQGHLADWTLQFGRVAGNFKVRAFEVTAAAQFSQDHPDENDGDLIGYLLNCINAGARVWGSGNGFRRVDGSPM